MVRILKLALLFLAFDVLVSCLPDLSCSEVNYMSTNKIQFGNYYRYYSSKDALLDYVHRFSFYEDSSFSFLIILHQNKDSLQDTLTMLNGKFKVYKDTRLPWYVLRLNADSIYEKTTKDTLDGILYFTDFASSKFEGFSDSLLSDNKPEALSDSLRSVWGECFRLNIKYSLPNEGDWAEPCGYKDGWKYGRGEYWHLSSTRSFCQNKPEETPEQNSIGDSL